VLFLELAFRLQIIVQVATVNSAAFDVNLKRSLADFGRRWPVLASFFRKARLRNAGWYVMSLSSDFVIS
jgi:hypothetical protein